MVKLKPLEDPGLLTRGLADRDAVDVCANRWPGNPMPSQAPETLNGVARADRKAAELPGRQSRRGRIAAALSTLVVPLGGAACGTAMATSGDPSASSQRNLPGVAPVVAGEICVVGRPTAEGIECQAFRAGDGRLYTLIGDFGGLAVDDDRCVCGQPVEISTCMQGTTIRPTRIGPSDTCP